MGKLLLLAVVAACSSRTIHTKVVATSPPLDAATAPDSAPDADPEAALIHRLTSDGPRIPDAGIEPASVAPASEPEPAPAPVDTNAPAYEDGIEVRTTKRPVWCVGGVGACGSADECRTMNRKIRGDGCARRDAFACVISRDRTSGKSAPACFDTYTRCMSFRIRLLQSQDVTDVDDCIIFRLRR